MPPGHAHSGAGVKLGYPGRVLADHDLIGRGGVDDAAFDNDGVSVRRRRTRCARGFEEREAALTEVMHEGGREVMLEVVSTRLADEVRSTPFTPFTTRRNRSVIAGFKQSLSASVWLSMSSGFTVGGQPWTSWS